MKKIIIFIILCLISFSFFIYIKNKKEVYLHTPNNKYSVLVSNTEEKRILGLSNTTKLDEKTVMLFVFPQNDYHGIWMKDMNYSIDIVYLNEDMTVINYYDNISPITYPTVYYPEKLARYIVEMNSGERLKSGIDKGTKLYYK